ncbi:MotA/TolQ/ExbB proton channel family protein [Alphaproteobacteria bacterium]|nr:MotA/TolQ/ExbB proton channel family protein [Alphaproteobacteria bacterium]
MIDTSSGKVIASGIEISQKSHGMWDLFWEADLFVKFIMLLLVSASFLSWSIIISKTKEIFLLLKTSKTFDDLFQKTTTLGQISSKVAQEENTPMARIFRSVEKEMRGSGAKTEKLNHVDRLMQSGIRVEMDRLEKNIGFLATLGSAAPFIGLLGTVWGIMNSFQSIALSKNTSLDVVAPGIAEALAATALGLLAAIPAVIAYNKISIFLGHYSVRLEAFCDHLYVIYAHKGKE